MLRVRAAGMAGAADLLERAQGAEQQQAQLQAGGATSCSSMFDGSSLLQLKGTVARLVAEHAEAGARSAAAGAGGAAAGADRAADGGAGGRTNQLLAQLVPQLQQHTAGGMPADEAAATLRDAAAAAYEQIQPAADGKAGQEEKAARASPSRRKRIVHWQLTPPAASLAGGRPQ